MAKGQEFRFKQFTVQQDQCAMKVGTDGVLLGALATGGSKILDIGTGTGLVALIMAQRCPEAQLTAIDIDAAACGQAAQNVAQSPFAERITIKHTSLSDFADESVQGTFDAIVCNPPFFENSLECPDDRRTAARHTSSLPFAELVSTAARLLSDGGTMTVIIPTMAVTRMEAECAYCSLRIARRLHIKTVERKVPKRTLLYITKRSAASPTIPIGASPTPLASVETQCLMENGQRSEWYSTICRDFYL